MIRSFRVILAVTEGGVKEIAEKDGWTILNPIREFDGFDSEDDDELGQVDHLLVNGKGFVALCYKKLP